MRRFVFPLAALVLAAAFTTALGAQKMTMLKDGPSPHVRAEWTIDGGNLSIESAVPPSRAARPARTSTRSTARSGAPARTRPRRSRPTRC